MLPMLLALALAAGCTATSGGDAKPPEARPAKAARTSKSSSPTGPTGASTAAKSPAPEPPPPTGRVHGRVRLAAATQVRLKRLTNDVDVATCGEVVTADALVVGRDRGLANVVLEARSPTGEVLPGTAAAPPAEPARITLERCKMEPHVQVVTAGSELELRNVDGLLHEVVTTTQDNVAVRERMPRYLRLRRLGPEHLGRPDHVKIACDQHPWSAAWLHVSAHRAVTVTGPDGAFELKDLPPGEVIVTAWHESLQGVSRSVVIPPDGEVAVDVELR